MNYTTATTEALISRLQGNPFDEKARAELSTRPDRYDHMDPNPEHTQSNR